MVSSGPISVSRRDLLVGTELKVVSRCITFNLQSWAIQEESEHLVCGLKAEIQKKQSSFHNVLGKPMRSRFFTCNIGLIIPIQSYLITVKTL
jgi:hypothetical protein